MNPLFLDVDAQNDFVLPAGALYAPRAERVIPVIASLNRLAVDRGFTLISTKCLHEEQDAEFQKWPPHCVSGTVGQSKPASTLVGGTQRFFEKQTTDVFQSPRFLPLLQELDSSEYFVYGVVTEVCVAFAADGLLQLGKPVTVVSDAVCALNEHEAHRFFDRFKAAGGKSTDYFELLARFKPVPNPSLP